MFLTNPTVATATTDKPSISRFVGHEKCILMHYKDSD